MQVVGHELGLQDTLSKRQLPTRQPQWQSMTEMGGSKRCLIAVDSVHDQSSTTTGERLGISGCTDILGGKRWLTAPPHRGRGSRRGPLQDVKGFEIYTSCLLSVHSSSSCSESAALPK